MKIRNVEFYAKELTSESGKVRYQPWIKYEESGLLWGWNKQEHPINLKDGAIISLRTLQGFHSVSSVRFESYSTYEEAGDFIYKYSCFLTDMEKLAKDQNIISEKIIKIEEMKN